MENISKYFINYTATPVNAYFPDVKLYKNTLNVMENKESKVAIRGCERLVQTCPNKQSCSVFPHI